MINNKMKLKFQLKIILQIFSNLINRKISHLNQNLSHLINNQFKEFQKNHLLMILIKNNKIINLYLINKILIQNLYYQELSNHKRILIQNLLHQESNNHPKILTLNLFKQI